MTTPELIDLGKDAGAVLLGIFTVWSVWRQSKTGKIVQQVHILSNSAMGAQLEINVNFAKEIAVLKHSLADRSKADGDIAAAIAAEVVVEDQKKKLIDHQIQQAKVDAK
jgi:hypothetical protein